ncbi:unnamed protein product, partial [Rotaria sp. Silwood2]
MQAVVGGQAV